MDDYGPLINDYAVRVTEAPCDCEEIFGITDCGNRGDEVFSAIPVEDCQEMIRRAVARELGIDLDD